MKNFWKAFSKSFLLAFAATYAAGLIYGLVYIALKQTMPTYAAFSIGAIAGIGVLFGAYKLIMKVIACRD